RLGGDVQALRGIRALCGARALPDTRAMRGVRSLRAARTVRGVRASSDARALRGARAVRGARTVRVARSRDAGRRQQGLLSGVPLQAAAAAAPAGRALGADHHVTELPGEAVRPPEQAALDDHPGADADLPGDVHEVG